VGFRLQRLQHVVEPLALAAVVGWLGTLSVVPPMVGTVGRAGGGRSGVRSTSAARRGGASGSCVEQGAREHHPRACSEHGQRLRQVGHSGGEASGAGGACAGRKACCPQHTAAGDEVWRVARGCPAWIDDAAYGSQFVARGTAFERSGRGISREPASVPALGRSVAAVPGKRPVAERQRAEPGRLQPATWATAGVRARRRTSNGHSWPHIEHDGTSASSNGSEWAGSPFDASLCGRRAKCGCLFRPDDAKCASRRTERAAHVRATHAFLLLRPGRGRRKLWWQRGPADGTGRR